MNYEHHENINKAKVMVLKDQVSLPGRPDRQQNTGTE